MLDRTSRRDVLQGLVAFAALSNAAPSAAQSEAADFSGKSLRLLVGTGAGAGYDLIARLVAEHMPRYIVGSPRIVVENMVGAGSLVMMNYLTNRAPRDGTAFGLPLNGALLEPSLKLLSRGGGTSQFDVDQLSWIGSPCEEPPVLWVRSDTPFKAFEEVRRDKMIVGASQPAADNYTVALLNNRLLGTKLEIISGYQGTNDLFLAAERGEIQGGCTAYSAIVLARPEWVKAGRVRILAQFGRARMADLADVPTGIELAPDDRSRKMLEAFSAKFRAAYPFVLPPGVSGPRVTALRSAFDRTMSDKDFIASVTKLGMKLNPISGHDLTQLVREANALPDDLAEGLMRAIAV